MKGLEDSFRILMGIITLLLIAYVGYLAVQKEDWNVKLIPTKTFPDVYLACNAYLSKPEDYSNLLNSNLLKSTKFMPNFNKIVNDCFTSFESNQKEKCGETNLEKMIVSCSIVRAIGSACSEVCAEKSEQCLQYFIYYFEKKNLWLTDDLNGKNKKCDNIDDIRYIVSEWCRGNIDENYIWNYCIGGI